MPVSRIENGVYFRNVFALGWGRLKNIVCNNSLWPFRTQVLALDRSIQFFVADAFKLFEMQGEISPVFGMSVCELLAQRVSVVYDHVVVTKALVVLTLHITRNLQTSLLFITRNLIQVAILLVLLILIPRWLFRVSIRNGSVLIYNTKSRTWDTGFMCFLRTVGQTNSRFSFVTFFCFLYVVDFVHHLGKKVLLESN